MQYEMQRKRHTKTCNTSSTGAPRSFRAAGAGWSQELLASRGDLDLRCSQLWIPLFYLTLKLCKMKILFLTGVSWVLAWAVLPPCLYLFWYSPGAVARWFKEPNHQKEKATRERKSRRANGCLPGWHRKCLLYRLYLIAGWGCARGITKLKK